MSNQPVEQKNSGSGIRDVRVSRAVKNFIIGAGSLLNIAGGYHSRRRFIFFKDADFKALQNDWDAIGNDMKKVMETEFKTVHSTSIHR